MSVIAFAATASNTLGADPGVTISDYDPGGDVHVEQAVIDSDPGEDEYGDLDIDNADAILESNGWSRVGTWTRSGGQWGTEVEKTQNA